MKIQNTLGNKAKFFAQYWGQKVVIWNKNLNILPKRNILINEVDEMDILELTPLSQITDEDAKEITTICEEKYILSRGTKDGFRIETASSLSGDNQDRSIYYSKDGIVLFYNDGNWGGSGYKVVNTLKIYDYLRSKGYALPWMDLTIEDLIEYGWIKLKP